MAEISGEDGLAEALADRSGLLWVDLFIQKEEDGAVLGDVFHFHPLTIEDSVAPRVEPAKIDDHGDYIFLVIHAIGECDTDSEIDTHEVDFYLGPNYVVSCHQTPLPALAAFRERARRDEQVLSRKADWLLHGILDALVDEYLPVVDELDERIDSLQETVLHRPDASMLQGIMMVKRNTLRLRRAANSQRDIMNRLSRGEFPKLIHPGTTIYYRDIYDHVVGVEYLIEVVRDLADGTLNTYLSMVSNRLNEIVKVLTAAATIFLPLTLVASIYGMNLTEGFWPPTDSDWGFAAVLGVMLAVTLSLLGYFRWRRWI